MGPVTAAAHSTMDRSKATSTASVEQLAEEWSEEGNRLIAMPQAGLRSASELDVAVKKLNGAFLR